MLDLLLAYFSSVVTVISCTPRPLLVSSFPDLVEKSVLQQWYINRGTEMTCCLVLMLHVTLNGCLAAFESRLCTVTTAWS